MRSGRKAFGAVRRNKRDNTKKGGVRIDTILDYLDEIDDVLENSKAVPFSNNRVAVDRIRLTEILEDIRLNLPGEIEKAQRIVTDHERIVEDARRKAAGIIEDARLETSKLADEHEIAEMAYRRADQIINAAQRDAREIRQNAIGYADGLLQKAEDAVRDAMTLMNQATRNIDELFHSNLEIISQNRNELQENLRK